MPIGVPSNTAPKLITTLPKMALARPPGVPGGGVDSLNRCGPSVATPLASSSHRMKVSQIRPNTAALSDSTMKVVLARRRRKYKP